MFIDARAIPHGQEIAADVCIVGAGAAGIALARELAARGFAPVMLEAGGIEHDADGQALFRGDCVGLPYELDTTRARRLGGSTNWWGGFCTPFEAYHFERRPWIPHSGWPISREELDPYYRRAAAVCGLDPDGFAVEDAAERHPLLRESLFPFRASSVALGLSQVAHARRSFGKAFRAELRASGVIRVLLNATAAALLPDHAGRSIASVRAVSEAGREFTVRSRAVVLAAGAIENARLLLLSDGVHAGGVGNGRDLVGRYFMEHPRLRLARAQILRRPARGKLYDSGYAVHRLPHCLSFRLPYDTQAEERVGHVSHFFDAESRGENSPGVQSLKAIYEGLDDGSRRRRRVSGLAWHVGRIARDWFNVGAFACWQAFGAEFAVATRYLAAVVEPCPNPDSRVTLGADVDRLGMRRVRLDWRLTEGDRRTVRRTTRVMCERLQGLADIRVEPLDGALDGSCLDQPDWTWHHMGTTRMAQDPREGVVDRDGRVHGIGNLFIAGSSVFPTSGNHSPTFTLVALSLRLADHLAAGRDRVRTMAMAEAGAAPGRGATPRQPPGGGRGRSVLQGDEVGGGEAERDRRGVGDHATAGGGDEETLAVR